MVLEKKRVSAKRRMMHAALNEDFLYQALFTEYTPMPWPYNPSFNLLIAYPLCCGPEVYPIHVG
jgi:hypothetical protein